MDEFENLDSEPHPLRRAEDHHVRRGADDPVTAAVAAAAAAAAMPPPVAANAESAATQTALIQYQLTHLTMLVQNGFSNLETALDVLSDRVRNLENWREREEAVSHAMARQQSSINQRAIPIMITIATVIATIVAALIAARVI